MNKTLKKLVQKENNRLKCQLKRKIRSEREALEIIKTIKRQENRLVWWYRCDVCCHIHITSTNVRPNG